MQSDLERLRETRKNYDKIDNRRFDLIEKEYKDRLKPEEKKELEQLQKRIGEYINIVHPQAFGPLEVMEQKARELSSDTNQTGQQ